MSLPRVFVLNGPNLNMLGVREPAIYGTVTLAQIEQESHEHAKRIGLSVDFRQSNFEGEIVGWLHEARDAAQGVIINAAAYTHTSVAIHDAIKIVEKPIVELHLVQYHKRGDAFRETSYVSTVATGVICGLSARGYVAALDAIKRLIVHPRS